MFIKSIFRTSADLKTPSGEILTLKIQNPAGEEILKKEVTVSDFGSINTSYLLSQDAKLGAYSLNLSQGDTLYAYTSFNVEVFQKPKFKNEVMLQVQGLNDELVSIKETKKEMTRWGYEREIYT